jgi:hypothetical protein
MLRSNVLRAPAVAVACFAVSDPIHAQVKACSNAQLNQAFTAMTMVPRGSGVTGDCNPNYYYPGGPTWTLSDLEVRVVHARACTDPWIGQIYWELYQRNPTSAECTTSNYGGGSWSGYADLKSKVQTYQMVASSPKVQFRLPQYHVDNLGNLLNSNNAIVAKAGHYLINATIVAQGAGNIILQGGGNIVAQGAGNIEPRIGMIVNTNGSNFIVLR